MGVLEFALIGAVIGGAIGAVSWVIKANKIRKHFNVNKGMSYEQIVAALGEPVSKREKGEKLVCIWSVTVAGRRCNIGATFINNIAKSIG